MEQNVGSTDRLVRIIIGAAAGIISIGILAGVSSAPAVLSPILGILAIVLLGTAATGMCGLYSALGISTCSGDRA